jgi:hypothetical protein
MGCLPSKESKEEDERHREARSNAAEAALRRQQQYEATPHGRATKASIEKAKREQAAATRNAGDAPMMRWQVG